jgi:hypothetical protein
MSITARARVTDRIMGVMAHTDQVTRVMAHTDPVMQVMAHTDLVMRVMAHTKAPSRSRLAIGPIIIAALVIMWAGAITSGGRDIGYGATVKESGSTGTTL